MDKVLQDKLVEIITQLQNAAVQASASAKVALPKLTEIALRTVMWDGAWHLMLGAGLLALAAIPYRIGWASYRKLREEEPNGNLWDTSSGLAPCACIAWVAALVLLIASGFQLFNMWNWVAIIDPQAAAAYKILQMIKVKAGIP